MSLALAMAGLILLCLIVYSVLGGADFGGGVWDLLSRGPRAADRRAVIAQAIGPIWEANHVWMIAALVLLFSSFPPAFALLMVDLHVPITLALIGIVLRGSSFIFRKYDRPDTGPSQLWARIFAVSSLATPFLLGVVLGNVSTPTGGSWLQPFPVAVGVFTVLLFAFLAACYLTLESDDPELQASFRGDALKAGALCIVAAVSVWILAGSAAPEVRSGLATEVWGWPLKGIATLAVVGTLLSLLRRRYHAARILAAATVALVILGWGLAMHPYLISGRMTFLDAAAPPQVLRALAVVVAAGALVLVPAWWYLVSTFKGDVIFGGLQDPPDA